MDYDEIGSNANHQYTKEVESKEKKRPEVLVPASISPRHKSLDRRIFDIMFPGTLEDMKDHMIFDVLIPRIRDGIWDMLSDGLSILFTGTTRRKNNSGSHSVTAKVQYGDYYDRDRRPEPSRSRRDDPPDPRDIGFDFEDQAKQVRDDLIEYIARYDQVPLAYFYDRCGITSDNWQGPNNYGWTELGTADVVSGRDEDGRRKWYINFPRPKYLK